MVGDYLQESYELGQWLKGDESRSTALLLTSTRLHLARKKKGEESTSDAVDNYLQVLNLTSQTTWNASDDKTHKVINPSLLNICVKLYTWNSMTVKKCVCVCV